MKSNPVSPLQEALEMVEALSPEDQISLIDVVRRRLVALRRDEIADGARSTLNAVREGKTYFGNLDELKDDLLEEP